MGNKHKIVAYSRNRCCHGKATIRFLRLHTVVEVQGKLYYYNGVNVLMSFCISLPEFDEILELDRFS